jgi:hypothetical protein
MYLEFHFRHNWSGVELLLLRRELVDWSKQHHIDYTEKTVKNTHRVCFIDPKDYTFFGLTWVPRTWIDYTIVDIP